VNIQQAAAQSGLTADTIRFDERKGVRPRPPRQGNGYRNYMEDHVGTLRLAKGLRHLAVPLDALAPMIAVAHSGTCGEVRGDLTGALREALAETEQH
jgi:DNA-binding transcriptional MerR regulator